MVCDVRLSVRGPVGLDEAGRLDDRELHSDSTLAVLARLGRSHGEVESCGAQVCRTAAAFGAGGPTRAGGGKATVADPVTRGGDASPALRSRPTRAEFHPAGSTRPIVPGTLPARSRGHRAPLRLPRLVEDQDPAVGSEMRSTQQSASTCGISSPRRREKGVGAQIAAAIDGREVCREPGEYRFHQPGIYTGDAGRPVSLCVTTL